MLCVGGSNETLSPGTHRIDTTLWQKTFFDAADAIERLKSGGFSNEQVAANVRFVREARKGGVATRADVEKVEGRLDVFEASLRNEMATLRSEMRSELKTFSLQIIASVVVASGLFGVFLPLTG